MLKKTFCLLFLMLLLPSAAVQAQVPERMSYQGMLTGPGGGPVEDGTYEMHFKLYNGSNPTTALWSETQTVSVVQGLFNAILGSVTPLSLPFDEQYYLGIAVADGAELTPRVALTSSAYSLRARSVDDGQVVQSINQLRDDVSIEAGDNIQIAQVGNAIRISAEIPDDPGITQITAGQGLTGGGSEGVVTLAVGNAGINSAMIASGAVTTTRIANNAVTTAKLADGAVGSAQLADNAVTTAKLANNSVNGDKVASNTLGLRHLTFLRGAMVGSWNMPIAAGACRNISSSDLTNLYGGVSNGDLVMFSVNPSSTTQMPAALSIQPVVASTDPNGGVRAPLIVCNGGTTDAIFTGSYSFQVRVFKP